MPNVAMPKTFGGILGRHAERVSRHTEISTVRVLLNNGSMAPCQRESSSELLIV